MKTRLLTVGALKRLLETLPDDAPVLKPVSNHAYEHVQAFNSTALFDLKSRTWSEDHGEDVTPEAEYGKRFVVLSIQ